MSHSLLKRMQKHGNNKVEFINQVQVHEESTSTEGSTNLGESRDQSTNEVEVSEESVSNDENTDFESTKDQSADKAADE